MTALTTPDNLPYPDDYQQPADTPAVMAALANATQAALTGRSPAGHTHPNADAPGSRRMLLLGQTSIPNNTLTPITGGWQAGAGDTGNTGLFRYSAGLITVQAACVIDVFIYVAWDANGTGRRRLELTITGDDANTYRDSRSPEAGVATGQILAFTGLRVSAGATLRVSMFQNSGGPLDVIGPNTRWGVRKVAD